MPRLPFRGDRWQGQPAGYAGRHAQLPPAGQPCQDQDGGPYGDAEEPAGPWAPVTVGEPIFDFEPQPPVPGGAYCPDTVMDGWSTPHLAVRLASVRGYAHRYHGIPRQDDAVAAYDQPSGTIIVAVADGVSSASHAHIGAATACQEAADIALRQVAAGAATLDWPAILLAAAGSLTARARVLLRTPSPGPQAVEELLATTLVAGCVTPTADGAVASIVQVGDSSGWLLRRGRFQPVLTEKNHPHAEILSSAVTPLPRLPARIAPVTVHLPHGAVLLLGSDGFGDPLGDGSGQVGRLFARHLHTPPPPRAFAHLLDFSRETFDDDRTLIAIWPLDPGQEVPG